MQLNRKATLIAASALLFPNVSSAGHVRPVLVVPGILGSMSKDLFCNNREVVDSFVAILAKAHVISKGNINAIVPEQWLVDPILENYTGLISEIDKAYPFQTVPVPYDWRLSIPVSMEQYLKPRIQEWTVHNDTIDIVAHSMGGLLVRAYLQKYGNSKIRRVVFLGTPHQGSVDAYYLWEGGMPKTGSFIEERFLKILLDQMKRGCGCESSSRLSFIRNGCPTGTVGAIASVEQLMPTFPYLQGKSLGSPRQKVFVEPNTMCLQNTFLFELNDSAESLIFVKTEYRIFAGATESTLLSIRPKSFERNCAALEWPDGKPRSNTKTTNGDNRVLFSKSACPRGIIPAFDFIPCITRDYIFPGRQAEIDIKHGDLPTIFKEEVVDFLKQPFCGDGYKEGTEQCDDGNRENGDCCSSQCQNEPVGTHLCGFGECRTVEEHCQNGAPIACPPINPPEPGKELTCDNLDNDCNGSTDDGNPQGGTVCDTGEYGVCAQGAETCINGSLLCRRDVEPGEELCDGLDNNCDGNIDEHCLTEGFTIKHYPLDEAANPHPHIRRDINLGDNSPESSFTTFTIDRTGSCITGVTLEVVNVRRDNSPIDGIGDTGSDLPLNTFSYYFDGQRGRMADVNAGAEFFVTPSAVGREPGRFIIYLTADGCGIPTQYQEIILVVGAATPGFRET